MYLALNFACFYPLSVVTTFVLGRIKENVVTLLKKKEYFRFRFFMTRVLNSGLGLIKVGS